MKNDRADWTCPNADAVWVITPKVMVPAKKGGAQAEEEKRLLVLIGASHHRVSDALAPWDDTTERKLEAIVGEIAVEATVLMEQQQVGGTGGARQVAGQIGRRQDNLLVLADEVIE